MWAACLVVGQVSAMPSAQVTASADCMLVIRKMWCGVGTALSQRKSVQPSTKIVRHFSSSATGPSAGVLPLEVVPRKNSNFCASFTRRSSLTLASVPAASSALRISIFRLPRRPPAALISSAASSWPLYMGSPSTAAGPVKNVMWPILYGVSGILPLGFSCAWATPTDGMTDPADAVSAAPTLTPSVLKKSRRFTSPAMLFPPLGSLPSDGRLPCPRGLRSSNIRSDQCQDAREEARLPVTGRALLVHGRRSLRRARVGLRRRHDGRPPVRGDGAPRGGVRRPLAPRAPAGSGLGLARLGVEERGRGRSVRECPRALDRSVQRRRVRRARAARRRARLHGSLERDTGGPLGFLAHRPGGRGGSALRGRRLPRLAGRAGPASELVERDLQVSCRLREPLVVGSKLDGLALGSQEFHRGQVQGVQRSDRPRERLQRPGQHGRRQLHEGNASDQRAHGFTVRAGQPPPMNPCPYLVLEQATRGQWLTPETLRRHAILGEEMGQGDGAVEIDHRSARSWPSSLRSWRSLVTGRRGGGSAPGIAGGGVQPRRSEERRV